MFTVRYRFVDDSGNVGHSTVRMANNNPVAQIALASALQSLSAASLVSFDVQRRVIVRTSTGAQFSERSVVVVPSMERDENGYPRDALYMALPFAPETVNGIVQAYAAEGFITRGGFDIDPNAVAIETLPDPQTLNNDLVLLVLRRDFWRYLLRIARSINTLGNTAIDRYRTRLDLYDLFGAVDMNEIIWRLDRIIELIEQSNDAELDDEMLAALQQIILLLGG